MNEKKPSLCEAAFNKIAVKALEVSRYVPYAQSFGLAALVKRALAVGLDSLNLINLVKCLGSRPAAVFRIL